MALFCMILHLTLLVQYRRVTEGQTDGHTMTTYTALAWCRTVKTDAARIIKLSVLIFHNQSWKHLFCGQKIKSFVRSFFIAGRNLAYSRPHCWDVINVKVTKHCWRWCLHSCECWLPPVMWTITSGAEWKVLRCDFRWGRRRWQSTWRSWTSATASWSDGGTSRSKDSRRTSGNSGADSRTWKNNSTKYVIVNCSD